MRFTKLRVLMVLAALAAASVVGVATAAPPDHAQSEHQRVVEFWTHARVAQAIPRDFVLDADGQFRKGGPPAGKGPGGGGDGGGDTGSSAVTGASWTQDGSVQATTGKVLFALGSSYYICSASVVADTDVATSLILTAAHCAYGDGFATNWMFIPDYDSAPAPLNTSGSFCAATTYGCWTAQALTVHQKFADESGFNLTAAQYDFAFATVGEGGHGNGQLDALGAPEISFAGDAAGQDAFAFGYPSAKKYKGNDLVYCAGPVGTDVNTGGATYQLLCDMTGGSSGGPWFSPFGGDTEALSSLNSYGYRGGDSMYGPMFNSNTAAVYDVALAGGGNTIVGP